MCFTETQGNDQMLRVLCFASQDILKCSPDEILALAVQKLHPFLDIAFKEAGMPIEPSSAVSGNNLNVTGDAPACLAVHKPCNRTVIGTFFLQCFGTLLFTIISHLLYSYKAVLGYLHAPKQHD